MQEGHMDQPVTTDQVQEQLVKLQSFLEEAKQKWDEENPKPKSWYDKNKTYLVGIPCIWDGEKMIPIEEKHTVVSNCYNRNSGGFVVIKRVK